jgi:hypothetical protein
MNILRVQKLWDLGLRIAASIKISLFKYNLHNVIFMSDSSKNLSPLYEISIITFLKSPFPKSIGFQNNTDAFCSATILKVRQSNGSVSTEAFNK